ncbi:MAG: carbamoyl-phosphate synthase large subunit, partial [Pseudomonadota bacterium]|nr:carbamoyl-phosphate synthase large subunit [Pseudomonadota bacterium]
MRKLLIANRGEIAIRIARSAAEMGIATVAVYSADDAQSLHTRKVDTAVALNGSGPAAYLDIAGMVDAARAAGADAVHPGYGFLAENAAFATACAAAGLVFVGPEPQTLALFGDKARARRLAEDCGVTVMPGTGGATTLDEAARFLAGLGNGGAMRLKAGAGGGGRGMRVVSHLNELEAAYERCASEAKAAFGNSELYAEQVFARARHIEVQIVGDGTGAVSHLWDRECTLQRQRQKLIEIAPANGIHDKLREKLFAAAVTLAGAATYKGLGTIEFLVNTQTEDHAFIEANARLQVEHTVTEEVTGLDLVRLQLEIAGGRTLDELRLSQKDIPRPRGLALEARINMETMAADGTARPAGGILSAYEPPSGLGIRVDGFGYAGYQTSARFDSLLAKLIVHAPTAHVVDAAAKAYRALCEFKTAGVPTNIAFLQNLLQHPALATGAIHTRFVEEHIADLLPAENIHQRLFFEAKPNAGRAGAQLASDDPLAVLHHGKSDSETAAEAPPEGTSALRAPLQGTVVSLSVAIGDAVHEGQPLLVMEAMKMEHVIGAHTGGIVRGLAVAPGDTVFEAAPLAFIEEAEVARTAADQNETVDLDAIRPDLVELYARRRYTEDAARPDAVEKRRKTGQRTARENIEDLCDP